MGLTCQPKQDATFKSMMISYESYQDILKIRTTKKRGREGNIEYINYPFSFDTETSSFMQENKKACCMYMWGFGYGDKCYIGRTWGDFLDLYNELVTNLKLNYTKRIIVYVHNLGYDFQFMRKWLPVKHVFSVKEREPLYVVTKDGIEFRDSLLLSGLSLEKTAESLTKHDIKKLVGDLDYSLIRHCETPISDTEKGYLINDCLVVTAYISEQIEQYKSVAYIPYTKTGKVRKWCRQYINNHEDKWIYREIMSTLTLTEADYVLCKNAYAGGFSHANPMHVGEVLSNIESFDFTSSYPAVICSELYPMSAPEHIHIKDVDELKELRKGHNIIFNVTLEDVESKITYEHYISSSKCLLKVAPVQEDNGRLVKAKLINITITEIDWDIITRCYSFTRATFGKAIRFISKPLPRAFLECVYHFYEGKTTLKGVENKEEEYLNMKENLNSLYGMCVTDILKEDIIYDAETQTWLEERQHNATMEEYNKKKDRFLYYPWGIYITAYARRNLWSGIFELRNDYIYSDTDSLKVLHFERHAEYFKRYNERIQQKLAYIIELTQAKGNYKPLNKKGVEKILGVWDREEPIKKFKTLGAKRYMCYYGNREYKITIAGLSKSYGAKYLKKTYKNMKNIFAAFKDEMSIPKEYTNKKTHTYIDEEMAGYVTDYLGNTAIYHELSGIHLSNSPFVLSLSEAFKLFLTSINDE